MRFYEDWSDADLSAAILKLTRDLARGVSSISHGGQTITYSSPANIRRALREMKDEQTIRRGGRRRTRIVVTSPTKGF